MQLQVFLCSMDDGSGHDYASDDERLSLSTVVRRFNVILGAFVHLHQKFKFIFKCWSKGEC